MTRKPQKPEQGSQPQAPGQKMSQPAPQMPQRPSQNPPAEKSGGASSLASAFDEPDDDELIDCCLKCGQPLAVENSIGSADLYRYCPIKNCLRYGLLTRLFARRPYRDLRREASERQKRIEQLAARGKPAPEPVAAPDAKEVQHRSDCAVHNDPAMPRGPCDCGAEKPAEDSA